MSFFLVSLAYGHVFIRVFSANCIIQHPGGICCIYILYIDRVELFFLCTFFPSVSWFFCTLFAQWNDDKWCGPEGSVYVYFQVTRPCIYCLPRGVLWTLQFWPFFVYIILYIVGHLYILVLRCNSHFFTPYEMIRVARGVDMCGAKTGAKKKLMQYKRFLFIKHDIHTVQSHNSRDKTHV